MNRITDKDLQAAVDRINRMLGMPMKPYEKDAEGRYHAQIGNFHLSHQYGGVCVHRMSNEDGGVSTPIMYAHVPKREAYEAIHAFIRGLEFSADVTRAREVAA